MSDNFNSQDSLSFSAFTKEDFLARAIAAQDQLRQQNPDLSEAELHLKPSTGWWKRAFTLPVAIEKSVPKDINNEIQAASREFAVANYSREALDNFGAKVRTILAEYPEALQLIETNILDKPEVWNQMHKHSVSKQNDEDGNIQGSD